MLVNMDEGRKRLEYLRQNPRVSITRPRRRLVVPPHHAARDASRSRTTRTSTDIDRISKHYMGNAYSQRDRGRVSGWIEVESWHAWNGGEPWTRSAG